MRRIVILIALVFSGCGMLGLNTTGERSIDTRAGQAIAKSGEASLSQKGVAPMVGTATAGGDVNIQLPDKPPESEYRENKRTAASSDASSDTSESNWLKQRNPYTLILMGAGLILIAVGLVKLWGLIKNSSIGAAATLADDALKAQIERLKARRAATADPREIALLGETIIEAEKVRDEKWTEATGK